MSDAPATVLRILTGRLAGTETILPAAGQISIGHQFWQNVVIRTPETKGIALELATEGAAAARLTVLTGEASFLGSTLVAGQSALVPPYVPFAMGGVAMAWGDPAGARWDEAGGLASAGPPAPPVSPTIRDKAIAAAGQAGDRIGDRLRPWHLAAVAGTVAVLLLALVAMPLVDLLGLRPPPAVRVSRALQAQGLGMLRVVADPASRGVVVSGVVPTEADRVRAQAALDGTGVPGTVSALTSEGLAQAAVGVAAVQGLHATARPIGRTAVELHTVPLEPRQREKLLAGVRADARDITRLVVREDVEPPEDATIRTVADVTKKVSTVVAGDPAYIQTADGARYFPGAVMPTGHRLVAIEGQSVLLEKNGRQMRLNF